MKNLTNKPLKLEIQIFGATNSTTNYHLSQYVGTDKPTYLGDYNGDMLKIDTAVKANETASTTNTSNIGTINTNIGTMSSLKTTATTLVGGINETVDTIGDLTDLTSPVKTSVVNAINSVNTNVGDPTNLYTDVKTNLVSAINEVVNKFNLNNIENPTVNTNVGSIVSTPSVVTVAKNSDGSLAKIYGTIQVTGFTSDTILKITMTSSLRPTSQFTINNAGICRLLASNGDLQSIKDFSITIKTNGDIEMESNVFSTTNTCRFMLMPCLYWIKDFGDIPSQE